MATHTVKQSGGDFSSLSAALADAGTGNGDTISIEGTWTVDDTAAATIADDNLIITTDSSSKHPGYWDESQNHYRLVVSSGHALTLNGSYTLSIDGVAIEQSGTGISDECFRVIPGSADTATITNCLFQCSTNTDQQDCIYTGYNITIGTVALEQCVMYGAARAGINIQNFYSAVRNGAVTVNSCTLWNNGRYSPALQAPRVGGGINYYVQASGDGTGFSIDVHNTIAIENDTGDAIGGNSPADYNEHIAAGTGIGSWDVSYSIDSDGSIATDTDGGTGNLASRTATDNTSPGTGDWVIFEDITSAPYDLRLVDNAENDAQDMHTTATAHSLTIPSTDIVGTSRPQNTNYDCGAFEIAAVTDTLFVNVSPSANYVQIVTP